MKIGYLLQQSSEIRHPPYDGPANHVRHVIAGLTLRGHSVRLLANVEGQLWQSDDLEQFEPVRAPEKPAAPLVERGLRRIQSTFGLPYLNWFDSRRYAAACVHALAGCDLLYERMSWMGYGGGLAARQMGIPLVLEYNGDHLLDLHAKGMAPTGAQLALSLRLMRAAVRRASRVIPSGDGWREHFLSQWDVPAERVSTVENGTTLVERLDRAALRSFQPAGRPGPLTIVYLGGFYPWHGAEILLAAFGQLVGEGIHARLLMIGSGSHFAETHDRVEALGLQERVEFTGQLGPEAYAPRLAAADIAVSPYCGWKEYSGMKLFDYKAAGLAIVASGENGHPRTLQAEQTGLIVPPCDPFALAAALRRLCRDEPLRRRLGQAARLEAENCHTWDHTVAKLEVVLEQVRAGEPAHA